jgi:hypothetical protein
MLSTFCRLEPEVLFVFTSGLIRCISPFQRLLRVGRFGRSLRGFRADFCLKIALETHLSRVEGRGRERERERERDF